MVSHVRKKMCWLGFRVWGLGFRVSGSRVESCLERLWGRHLGGTVIPGCRTLSLNIPEKPEL